MNKYTVWLLCFLLASAATYGAIVNIPLPAAVNEQEVGELNASVENEQLRAIDIKPVLDKLKQLLTPTRYESLATNNVALVPVSDLEDAGVQVRFDYQNLKIHLTVPTGAMRSQTLDLLGVPNFSAARTVTPSDFSAYMNVRGGVTLTETAALTNSQPFDEPQWDFENVFNWHGLVLQNETVVNPTPTKTWEKRDTRLVWDQPEHRLRWELGDLNYPVTSFQGFIPMAGLSLHKEDSLQPFRLTSPLGQSAFFLKENSKVDIVVNGHTVQTLQLNAGPHQISNFPLSGGANDVLLRITDPVGRVEYIHATMFYDPGLLKAGEREFNVAVGFPSRVDPESPVYDYRFEPAASAFYRYGVSDRLALGANSQLTEDSQQAGANVVVNTIAGTVGLEAAFSHDRAIGSGHAERLQYQYYFPSESILSDGLFTASAQYESADFVLPNAFVSPVEHDPAWVAQVNFSQRLTDHFNAGAGYSHSWADGRNQRETYSMTAGCFWGGLHANVSVERTRELNREPGWGAFVFLTFNFNANHSVYTSYDSREHISRSEWQYTGSESVETFDATLGVQDTPSLTSGYGSVRYTGRRAELTLSQDVLSGDENLTSLHWGSAVVFADGAFGISRPISDSFAVLDSRGSLHDEGGVAAQPLGKRYLAQEDWLGPAVLPQLTSYYPVHLVAEPRQASADFDPQTGDLRLEPTYRSGMRILLGQDAIPDVTLNLTWADGKPAALQAGTFTSATGESTEFISNRDGLVYIHGLKPGTYQGTLVTYPDTVFTITIPGSNEKVLNLGAIRVPIRE